MFESIVPLFTSVFLTIDQWNIKTNTMKKLLILSILVVSIVACGDDGTLEIGANGSYEVDPEFEPYVQEFIQEGAKRGHDIDFSESGLRIEFTDVGDNSFLGRCWLGRHHVQIDKGFWFSFSERFRSFLLFHELGHCELDQGHRNELFDNNVWSSIMRGDPFTGIEPRIPIPYFGFRKEYYLDELFNPNTPEPQWSKVVYDYDQALDRSLIVEQSKVNRVSERYTNPPDTYEMEAIFQLPTEQLDRTRFEWGTNTMHYYIVVINGWGYHIGLHEEQLDNNLYYSNNTTLVNNRPIEKFTVRQHDGVTQVFINDQFIFHLDPLSNIEYSRVEATRGDVFINTFGVESFVMNEIN